MTEPNPNPVIHLEIPLAGVNLLLQGLASLPIGQAVDLFLHLRQVTQSQIDAIKAAAEAEAAKAAEKVAKAKEAPRADAE